MAEPTRYKVGEAPWEKQQEPTRYKVGEAPWEKQGIQTQTVLDEAIPEISWKDRALVKNLATNDDESFNYLQKQYPQLNFKKINGEIVAKKPGENVYRKLDPNKLEWSDISDVAYDVGSGVLSSAATAGAGIAGALGGGVGAIPAAMAAGGLSSAGLEAARQKLGTMAGVNQGPMDLGSVGTSGAFGLASPLLLGSGASAKAIAQGAAKAAAGKEVSKEALESFAKTQSGALNRFKGWAAPKVGSLMSGIDEETILNASKNLEKVKAADTQGHYDLFKGMADEFKGSFDNKRRELGKSIGSSKEMASTRIDLSPIREDLDGLIKSYEDVFLRHKTPEAQSQYEYIKQMIESRIPQGKEVDAKTAFEIKDILSDIGNIVKSKHQVFDERSAKLPKVDADLERITRTAASKLSKKINDANPELAKLNKEYSKLLQDGETINKYFDDPKKVEATLRSIGSKNKEAVRTELVDLGERLGIDVVERAKEHKYLSTFAKPTGDVQSLAGTTSTSRTIPLAGIGATLGWMLGQGVGLSYPLAALGGWAGAKSGSPAALRAYMEANRAAMNASRYGNALTLGASAPAATISAWQKMYQNRRE